MKILVCMDDTDNLESRGTGQLAQIFSEIMEKKGMATCSTITRHQLFVHEDIPYTSHNSSMCFEMNLAGKDLQVVIDLGMGFLAKESAEGSDPGFCVTVLHDSLNKEKLIRFGQAAKENVLSKKEAYDLAEELGIHLTEHGGTGDGIIGALAGTGLRLSGNDGRFRGWFHFGRFGETIQVVKLLSYDFIDEVRSLDGTVLKDDVVVSLGDDKMKIIYKDWKQILLVSDNKDHVGGTDWMTLSKEQVKRF